MALLIITTFSPWRGLAQLLPFFAAPAVLVLFPTSLRQPTRYAVIVSAMFGVSLLSGVFNATPVVNYGMGLVTWFGGFATLFLAYGLGHYVELRPLVKLLLWVALIQVPIGLLQVFAHVGFELADPFEVYGAAGDYFGGTLLLSGKNSHIVGLKIAMSMVLAWLALRHVYRWGRLRQAAVIVLLIIGWVTPSAIHSFVAFVAALVGFSALSVRRIRTPLRAAALTSVAVLFLVYTQPDAVHYAKNLIGQSLVITSATHGKVAALHHTLYDLPGDAPAAPLIGLGLGRYSSFAALLLTGEFLTSTPSFLPVSYSPETASYILPYWNRALLESDVWAHGVVNQPFFTYMSLYGELGTLGLTLFALFWAVVIRDLLRARTTFADPLQVAIANALLLTSLFLICLFFFDNWFEDARLTVPYFALLGVVLKAQTRSVIPSATASALTPSPSLGP